MIIEENIEEKYNQILGELVKQNKFSVVVQTIFQRAIQVLIFIYMIHICRHEIGNFELFKIVLLSGAFVWISVVDKNHNSKHLEYLFKTRDIEKQVQIIVSVHKIFNSLVSNMIRREDIFKTNLSKKEKKKVLLSIVKEINKNKIDLMLEAGMVQNYFHEKVYSSIKEYIKLFEEVEIFFRLETQEHDQNISSELWFEANKKLLDFMTKELNFRKEKLNYIGYKLNNIFGYLIHTKWE